MVAITPGPTTAPEALVQGPSFRMGVEPGCVCMYMSPFGLYYGVYTLCGLRYTLWWRKCWSVVETEERCGGRGSGITARIPNPLLKLSRYALYLYVHVL